MVSRMFSAKDDKLRFLVFSFKECPKLSLIKKIFVIIVHFF